MKDVIHVMQIAQQRLEGFELGFTDKVQTVLAILRAKGVVARTTKATSDKWHVILAGALVVAFEDAHDLYLPSRRAETLVNAGVSSKLISWLDACVEKELLISQSPTQRADGRLALGELLQHYLAQPAIS
jgi:hypothetical protein